MALLDPAASRSARASGPAAFQGPEAARQPISSRSPGRGSGSGGGAAAAAAAAFHARGPGRAELRHGHGGSKKLGIAGRQESAGKAAEFHALQKFVADRSERNKPEHRTSSQGPLSSIRAVIKRTSRTTIHGEPQRERRRPEITIVAAEPLGPAWFPSGGRGAPTSIGCAPPAPASQIPWRTTEPVPAGLPPSYEQVIKEISQVQVPTAPNNAAPRSTTTSATQTDFAEETDSQRPGSAVHNQLIAAPELDPVPVQYPPKPPRTSLFLQACNLAENTSPLITVRISDEQNDQENSGPVKFPVPKPRLKSNLKPVVSETLNIIHNGEALNQPVPERDSSLVLQLSPFEDNFLEGQVVEDTMSTEKPQNSIVSRIKAFESQANTESSSLSKKPEIVPRSFATKPTITAGKPTPGPKPVSNRTSGEWNLSTDGKPKATPREWPPVLSKPQETSSIVVKPELPKKPKPSHVKSTSNNVINVSGVPSFEDDSTDGGKSTPVPAPRPLLPKRAVSLRNAGSQSAALKPVMVTSRLTVATQAKAFTSVEDITSVNPPAPVSEGDLISFDDEAIPTLPITQESNSSEPAADPFQLFIKPEPPKEQPTAPAPVRKPTVIRIPNKMSRSVSEDPQAPPPLPANKPIGSLFSNPGAKPGWNTRTGNVESEHSANSKDGWAQPMSSSRALGEKVVPARPPAHKSAPGRPPPPKISSAAASSQKVSCRRSSSEVGLSMNHNASGMKRSKSQLLRQPAPKLPPRPRPGHLLYNKYVMPVPHGIALKDVVSKNPGDLSFERGDVLVLMERTGSNYFRCQKGEEIGEVHLSKMRIITELEDERVGNGHKEFNSVRKDGNTPHAFVLHDFPAEEADDLGLYSGESVHLLEKIDNEWYRGTCRGLTGIFPASYVRVIVDVPECNNEKKGAFSQPTIKGPRCVSRFEFIGDQKDELSFAEGEVIGLKEYVSEEWARGELKGQTGIFPLNFVEVVEDLPGSSPNRFMLAGSEAQRKNKRESFRPASQHNRSSGEWYEALYDFAAETDEDLPFRKGDFILITEHLDAEWCRGRLDEREGILPLCFVQPSASSAVGAKSLEEQDGWKKGKAKALYDFHGENEHELSFKAGDLITELESVDDDWMTGEARGRAGMFPKNFVKIL
ncbi:SH3 domain-containing protein 19 isoform X2 [Rhinatrema bivittatum]|uniref:SH3 domain-containing protein 19 isoform X2 n=1 Tax=Rhinatrema bivittatum TaxID=194408 RepID=UPI00112B1BDD|nr:SH3 domain-containing protein 19 isoform X2 [Rhinatrema bivittatum]